MGVYKERILPYLVARDMRLPALNQYRIRMGQTAAGAVLEVGVGAGANFPYYSAAVQCVVGIDTSMSLLAMARREGTRFSKTLAIADAEVLPFKDKLFDTVVATWCLCTIPNVDQALSEARRVLRSNGQLLFIEHGRAPDPAIRKWQDRLTPLRKWIGGGCHLNRPIDELIERAGFAMTQLVTGYMPGAPKTSFMYEGRAIPM